MNKTSETMLWFDNKDENHYYTFVENGCLGVRDSNNNIILKPSYTQIIATGIINTDKSGWGKRPYKYFLLFAK